jgi:hypothetical protein
VFQAPAPDISAPVFFAPADSQKIMSVKNAAELNISSLFM